MAITLDQILAVADDLDARGVNPTLAAVRKALGAGSFTTISEAMSVWRAQKSSRAGAPAEPIPDAVESSLAELGRGVWAAAQAQANARLTSEREELEQARAQADTERAEAVALADSLALELDQAREVTQGQKEHILDLEARISLHMGELAASAQQVSGLQARVDELLNRVQDLSAELARGHARNAELSATLATLAAKVPSESTKPGEAGQ